MASNNSSVRSFIPMANKYDRVVLLIDMDCFYCQVEEKLDPSLKDQPLAVVQYNAWKGGGIIAVNYAARAKGVTRYMRGDEAREQCPEIQLVKVPNVREKADLTKYREAGKEVANVLQRFTPLLERASVDEAYLDVTSAVNNRLKELNDGTFILQPQELSSSYAVGFKTIGEYVTTVTKNFITDPTHDNDYLYSNYNENDIPAVRQSDIRLLIGASIANEIRSAVKAETSYECSAGIAHNKILAKLACGINKPNKQTILPLSQIHPLFATLPVGKIKGLGAKFGEEVCERLSIRYLGQLLKFTEVELQKKIDEKNGSWLYNICRGIDLEAVTPRFYSKSIGCCKKFPGRNSITGIKTLQHWLNELANEINERLEKDICENNRRAKQMVVNFIQEFDTEEVSSSRSAPLQCYDIEMLAKTSLEIIKANTKQFFRAGSENVLNNPIKFLGISVGKFETNSNSQNNIQQMFAQQAAKKQKLKHSNKDGTEISSITTLDTKCMWENESDKSTLHQLPKEKQCNVKSFFLRALNKKETTDSENKSFHGNDTNTTVHTNLDKWNYNDINITPIAPDEQIISNYESSKKGSFFVRALNKEEDIKIETFGEIILNHTDNSNEYQIAERNASTYGQQNFSQYEENENNFEAQNKNQFNVLGDIKTRYKSNVNDLPLQNNDPITMKRKHDKISDTEEYKQSSYLSQYAEFALPEFKPELLQFSNCFKCNAKVLNNPMSLQSHEDLHYAQELSQQQRLEFRDEIRSKINSSKSPKNNKKSKKVLHSAISKTSSSDIKKFLKPSSSLTCDENKVPEIILSNTEICDICKLPIEVGQFMEHKDFHVAKELQKKLNQLEVHTIKTVQNFASPSAKKSMKMQPNKAVTKPITQFFNQSNM